MIFHSSPLVKFWEQHCDGVIEYVGSIFLFYISGKIRLELFFPTLGRTFCKPSG